MKKIFLTTLYIALICIVILPIYKILPIGFTLIFAPVNYSLWEFLKIIFTSYVVFFTLKVILLKRREKNDIMHTVIITLVNITLFLVLYFAFSYVFTDSLIMKSSIYILSIFLTQILHYKIIIKKIKPQDNKTNNLFIIPIVIIYIIFAFLSYYPLNNTIFYDETNKKHGIHFR